MSNLILTYRHYPISIARYFRRALVETGHNVWSAGTFSPTIPWRTDKDYSWMLDVPDFAVPESYSYPIEPILQACPFEPDGILSFDAGFYCRNVKEHAYPNALILTDPHALPDHYDSSVEHYSKVFCMQDYYARRWETDKNGNPRSVWYLPYAADPKVHYWNGTTFEDRPFDVCIISGLLYPQRRQALLDMEAFGLAVHHDSAIFFDEASHVYGHSVMAFNWSSQQDLCARVWEGFAMRNLVITNRVPDLSRFGALKEDVHYVAFDTIDELLFKASHYARNREQAWEIASRGYEFFWSNNHSYLQRAASILDVMQV